ncbi:MAG: VWA domain-containing protein [Acetilactobacillus jinshanensis]
MDLMGTVSNYIQPVKIFVDNSGSMGDNEISYLLGELGDFLKHFPVNVTVYDFDTEVHAGAHYRANNYHQIKFTRVGGGGTRFQSIFDYCHRYFT